MSGTRPTPAEQHLGDRLAALVDGELGHDARERVLAHLATCPKCKSEADAQRRLKSVFAQAPPPPPSAGLLARLHGLPGGGTDGGEEFGGPLGPGLFAAGEPLGGYGRTGGGRGPGAAERENGPSGPGPGVFGRAPVLAGRPGHGFAVYQPGAAEAERGAPGRGRRFAFAAAGAVSLAAIALGSGAVPTGGAALDVRGEVKSNNVTPLRAPSAAPAQENRRRGGATGFTGTGTDTGAGRSPERPATPPARSAPRGDRPVVGGQPLPAQPFPATRQVGLSGTAARSTLAVPLALPLAVQAGALPDGTTTGGAAAIGTPRPAPAPVTPWSAALAVPPSSSLPLTARR
ncbi:zf-HC2 domain-containing protein [Streptomyces sp. LP05-1]|uniref:Zf-HC2 domain-containing protein n=1 Tax=Streptomyces pyxinae TaxID=2970734 RepID=A0ABT2CAJ0_9ACTN|nr:zf-HC2 domain-containing protein [Streptomyces sp. LP05-1]MCS0634434.1 zf-HC2 domain-containing protein [Streptomyces sp. LP05-1]